MTTVQFFTIDQVRETFFPGKPPSKRTILRWIKSGQLEASQNGKRGQFYITEAAMIRYFERTKVRVPLPPDPDPFRLKVKRKVPPPPSRTTVTVESFDKYYRQLKRNSEETLRKERELQKLERNQK